MTGPVFLIGGGVMTILAGVIVGISTWLGVPLRSDPVARVDRFRKLRLRPVHGVATVAGLLALLLTGWVAIGFAAAGAVLVVPGVLARATSSATIERLEALGAWTRRLADLLSSGAVSSLDRALTRSAAVAPAAIGPEVTALVSRMGPKGTRAALLIFARDLADPVADEVVMSLILQLRHGGRGLAAVLTDLALHVEDQIRMRREIEADRAKPRSNVRTLVLLTLGLATGLVLFAHTYLAPYSTVTGQIALAGVVAIFATALLWLRSMIAQEPGQRLLVDADFTPVGAA